MARSGRVETISCRVGACAGLLLFALFGVFQGIYAGNAAWLRFAGSLSGQTVTGPGLPIVLKTAFTLTGILAAAVVTVGACIAAGWAAGNLISWIAGSGSLSPSLKQISPKQR